MREMINEATRTIEDSQTAQALHGLLSLKSPEPTASSAVSCQSTLSPRIDLPASSHSQITPDTTTIQVVCVHAF